MSGTKQSAWSFWPFFFGVIAISRHPHRRCSTPPGGSLLVAAIFHAQMNGPAWPDAQPWDMLGFVLVAIVVVMVNRRAMLTRGTAATEVLLPNPAGAPEEVVEMPPSGVRKPGAGRGRAEVRT